MTVALASIDAHQRLPATMTACSRDAGWRSLLLRTYFDPPEAEEFTTAPTPDHLIVLVTSGSCELEGRYRGVWHKTDHRSGSIGMTSPGEEATLRWRGSETHQTLQLHIPEKTILDAYEDLSEQGVRGAAMPNAISFDDPLIGHVLGSLSARMSEGVPELYAEGAVQFLTLHLLSRHTSTGSPAVRPSKRDDVRMQRVDDFLRANMASQITLDDVAGAAGISRFHLVRLFKDTYQETPFRRLTRIRIEETKTRLRLTQLSITEIAFACGFTTSAHFASTFRRSVGMSPTEYRDRAHQE